MKKVRKIKKVLYFYFPANGPGGVQSLIIRMIRAASRSSVRLHLIDHRSGYIQSIIKKENPETFNQFVLIVDNISEVKFKKGACLIIFNWQLSVLNAFFRSCGNVDYLYWDVHSEAVANVLDLRLFGNILLRQKVAPLIKTLLREKRLITIDRVSANFLLELSESDEDLPVTGIPLDSINTSVNFWLDRGFGFNNIINITYIARAVNWKIAPFRYALKAIACRYRGALINVRVYTDGKHEFKRQLGNDLQFLNTIEICEGFTVSDIVNRDAAWTNLSIGMGTSQFELLLYGVPTLLIPGTSNIEILSKVPPMWVHLMPDFVFGFDECSLNAFKRIGGTKTAAINVADFEWRHSDLDAVAKAADRIKQNLASDVVFGRVLACVYQSRPCYTKIFDINEVRNIVLWDRLVSIMKALRQRLQFIG